MTSTGIFQAWINFFVYSQIFLIFLNGQVNGHDHSARLREEIPQNIEKLKNEAYATAANTRDKSRDPSYVLDQYFNHVIPSYFSSSVYCSDVSSTVGLLVNRIRTNATLKDVEASAIQDCVVTKRYPSHQCKGFVERFIPTFYYIVKKRPLLTTETFVSTAFQSAGCGLIRNDPYMEWSIKIDKSPLIRNTFEKEDVENDVRIRESIDLLKENEVHQKQKDSRTGRRSRGLTKILQLSDLSLDIYYEAGTNAECEGFGPCCEADSGRPKNKSSIAGLYGDGRTCDTPDILLDKSLEKISQDHPDINIIYLTGDLAPHDQWRSTHLGNADLIAYVSQLVAYYFPNVTVVPVIGDQDPHPTHQFSPPGELSLISTQWLYTVTSDSWTSTSWLPKDQVTTFQIGGYYTKQVDSSLKIIVLNTNICFERNIWQMYAVRDPNGQLEWLQKELQKSEALGQFVHIIGHVPPGYIGCTKVWSRNYHNIITRYHATVKAQIFGHETIDTFHLFYRPRSHQDPISVQWVAPSFTPRQSNNPSYRIYYAHPYTWDLLEFEAYVLDLKTANAYPQDELRWTRLYKATEAYNIRDLRPDSVADLVERMALDTRLLATYLQYSAKELKRRPENSCNTYCRKRTLCRIVTPYISEEEECQALQRKIDGIVVPIYNKQ